MATALVIVVLFLWFFGGGALSGLISMIVYGAIVMAVLAAIGAVLGAIGSVLLAILPGILILGGVLLLASIFGKK